MLWSSEVCVCVCVCGRGWVGEEEGGGEERSKYTNTIIYFIFPKYLLATVKRKKNGTSHIFLPDFSGRKSQTS